MGDMVQENVYSKEQLGKTIFQLVKTNKGERSMPQCRYAEGHELAVQPKQMCYFEGKPDPAKASGPDIVYTNYAKAKDPKKVHQKDCTFYGKDYSVPRGTSFVNTKKFRVEPY